MRFLVSGSSGLIGSAVVAALDAAGHETRSLVRSADRKGDGDVYWNPAANELDFDPLRGFDGVVHLAGEAIASGRWSASKKARIRDSRVVGTRLLSEALARLSPLPTVLVSASAIGFYGHRGDDTLSEESSVGEGFLAEVARDWESATSAASAAGIRVVLLRFGAVLSTRGGALKPMVRAFRLGGGARIGRGDQFMSWISLPDATAAVLHVLLHDDVSGPVNAVSPDPVTNARFTKTLAAVLRRPAFLAMPAFAARMILGEMADELLLSSTRVEPKRLRDSGFEFRHPELEPALRDLLATGE